MIRRTIVATDVGGKNEELHILFHDYGQVSFSADTPARAIEVALICAGVPEDIAKDATREHMSELSCCKMFLERT